jgi:hypothetical protein
VPSFTVAASFGGEFNRWRAFTVTLAGGFPSPVATFTEIVTRGATFTDGRPSPAAFTVTFTGAGDWPSLASKFTR